MIKIITSRKKKALITKKTIHEKAYMLFGKKGYDNVTVNEICTELGFSRGAFYHYFKSKSDIVYFNYKQVEGNYLEYYNKFLHLPPDKQLRLMIDWYNNFFIKERFEEIKIVMKLELELDNDRKNFPSTNKLQLKVLTNIIEHGIDQGYFKNTIDANKMARCLGGHIIGLVYEWCTHDGKYELNEKINFFYENLFLVVLLP